MVAQADIANLKKLIERSRRMVFFGGAGVSTESGIPDFRSQDGLYKQKYKYPPETILSHTFFMEHTEEFYEFYRAKMLCLDALPNAAHYKLAQWEKEGKLSAGHARALLAFPDEEGMRRAARLAVEQGLSVRQLEKMAQAARGETAEGKPKKEKRRLPYYDEVELALHEHLGRRVSVKGSQKKGTLQIEFYGQEDLAELLKLFGDD